MSTTTSASLPAALGGATATTKKESAPKEPKYKLRDDFSKSPRDFLKKTFMKVGEWKFESKRRGPPDMLYANPKYEDGTFSVDLQYDNTRQVATWSKLNMTTGGVWKFNTKSRFGSFGTVEVEATPSAAELTFDGSVNGVKVIDKVSTSFAEAVVAYDVAKHCAVGLFGKYDIAKGHVVCGGATRYADPRGYLLSLFAANNGHCGLAAAFPLESIPLPKGLVGSVLLNADGEKFAKVTKGEVGFRVAYDGCPYFPVVCAKLSHAFEAVVAVSLKLAAATTLAVTLQRSKEACCGVGYGVSITQE